jgi:hypothetical protein
MAKDRVCLECQDHPKVKGASWGSHCRDKHNKRKDVRFIHNDLVGDDGYK